jgi:predicted negative regulator of RcsB-dependent stress response
VETLQTDEQQVEALKKWWEKNGKATLGALIVGLGIVLGGRAWLDYRNTQSEAASMLYQAMVTAMQEAKLDAALEQGARLLGQYESTPYATLAALASAKIKLDQGDATAARTHLQWVMDHGKPEPMVHLARLRMARLLFDAGDAQQALSTLGAEPPEGFAAEYKELEGDIYRSQGETDKARTAYQAALRAVTPMKRDRSGLEMKLQDVGGEVPAESPPT